MTDLQHPVITQIERTGYPEWINKNEKEQGGKNAGTSFNNQRSHLFSN